jgi:hypothetical protein
MNLIQQFPDVSLQIRNRVKWNQKDRLEKRMSAERLKDNDPELLLFYADEFKKWHYKITVIIVLGITCLYSVVLAGSGFLQWIIMNRNSYNN